MTQVLDRIRAELRRNADENTKNSGRRFFKEQVELYGVKTAVVTRIAREGLREVIDLSRSEILALCEELWQSGYLEESGIACEWAYSLRRSYQAHDFALFERWVSDYVSNWAACDTLCNHTIGAFLEAFPAYVEKLKDWTGSPNRWVRRGAAVSLIIPARRGLFLADVLNIADRLLTDADDLVQKGYGWMLKAAAEAHRQQVFEFVMARKATMPRTALRYAIEKMPEELKAAAMARA